MTEWLKRVTAELDIEEELSDEDVEALLKIARVAAHASDDRRNAPLLTYLIGRSRGDRPLADILDAVQRSTS